jgi:hypothetical protein
MRLRFAGGLLLWFASRRGSFGYSAVGGVRVGLPVGDGDDVVARGDGEAGLVVQEGEAGGEGGVGRACWLRGSISRYWRAGGDFGVEVVVVEGVIVAGGEEREVGFERGAVETVGVEVAGAFEACRGGSVSLL